MYTTPKYTYRFFLDGEHFEDVMFEWTGDSRKGRLAVKRRSSSSGLDFCKENIDFRLIGA